MITDSLHDTFYWYFQFTSNAILCFLLVPPFQYGEHILLESFPCNECLTVYLQAADCTAWYGYQGICKILVDSGASLLRKDYQVRRNQQFIAMCGWVLAHPAPPVPTPMQSTHLCIYGLKLATVLKQIFCLYTRSADVTYMVVYWDTKQKLCCLVYSLYHHLRPTHF